jgi:hypothetical protein
MAAGQHGKPAFGKIPRIGEVFFKVWYSFWLTKSVYSREGFTIKKEPI